MNAEELEKEAYGKNVLNTKLQPCCPVLSAGFYKDGYCRTDNFDVFNNAICAQVSKQYLVFSKSKGEDLTKPNSRIDFPGLKPGDRWCLCTKKWKEALESKAAPPIFLDATHEKALSSIPLEVLKSHASTAKRDV